MSWIYLFIAGIFEIVWAVALKYADGVIGSTVRSLLSEWSPASTSWQ